MRVWIVHQSSHGFRLDTPEAVSLRFKQISFVDGRAGACVHGSRALAWRRTG